MPYIIRATTDPDLILLDAKFARIPQDVVTRAQRMELWGSSFTDPGADWCELVLFDAAGTELVRHRVEGY